MAEDDGDVLVGVRVSESVVAALRLAASERSDPTEAVGSDAVLAALARTDPVGDWSRVELRLGGPLPADRSAAAGHYDGVRLSGELCWALQGAVALMEAYGFPLLVPGLVAVAVLHDRSTAGSVPSERRIEARMARTAVFEDVLGADLPELDKVLGLGVPRDCVRVRDAIDRRDVKSSPALRHEAASFVDEDDPGACGLLMAAVRGDERLERLRRRIGVLEDDDARSSSLRGIPDDPATEVLDRVVRRRRSLRRRDVVYEVLLSPSWRVWELLGLRGVRPLDLAAAVALIDEDGPISPVGVLRDDVAGLARKVLSLWVLFALVRYRDPTAVALLMAPKVWARDMPVVVSLAAACAVVVQWGWVPGSVVLGMVALAAGAAHGERRSLGSFLGTRVSGATHRRATRLVGRGGLASSNFAVRIWVSKRHEALA